MSVCVVCGFPVVFLSWQSLLVHPHHGLCEVAHLMKLYFSLVMCFILLLLSLSHPFKAVSLCSVWSSWRPIWQLLHIPHISPPSLSSLRVPSVLRLLLLLLLLGVLRLPLPLPSSPPLMPPQLLVLARQPREPTSLPPSIREETSLKVISPLWHPTCLHPYSVMVCRSS